MDSHHHHHHHQEQQTAVSLSPHKFNKAKTTTSSSSNCKGKFLGVRQRPSGKWVAEIKDTTQKIRMWLGTFHTAEEAARAYDEAACLLRGANTRTNFPNHLSSNSPISVKVRNLLNHKRRSLHHRPSGATVTASTAPPSFNSGTHISLPSSRDISFLLNNGSVTPVYSLAEQQDNGTLDDAYRPDLSGFAGAGGLGLEQATTSKLCASPWPWPAGFDQFPFPRQGTVDCPGNAGGLLLAGSLSDQGLGELARINVERQMSASLYALNGVSDYLENGYCDPSDAPWDLPTHSQLFCPS